MSFKTTEIIVSLILLLSSIIAWVSIQDIPVDAQMFPNFILAGIMICSVLMIIRSLTGVSERALENAEDWKFTDNAKRMVGAALIFIVYLLVIEHLGYFTSSALLIMTLARFAGFKNWLALVSSAVGFCLFVYLVFVLIFDRPLPPELLIEMFTASR